VGRLPVAREGYGLLLHRRIVVVLIFHSCFVPVFFAHVVSSLGYPNLHGNKILG
jgi:hypothetical protein